MTHPDNHNVKTQMLIRRPASKVFEAFIDPVVTTNFWFTKSSGKLTTGKTVTWQWEMYGVSTDVHVKEIIQDRKISIEWGEPRTSVDFQFKPVAGDASLLAGLKAYLEHGLNLNLVADKHPKEITNPENKIFPAVLLLTLTVLS